MRTTHRLGAAAIFLAALFAKPRTARNARVAAVGSFTSSTSSAVGALSTNSSKASRTDAAPLPRFDPVWQPRTPRTEATHHLKRSGSSSGDTTAWPSQPTVHGGHGHTGGHTRWARARSAPTGGGHFRRPLRVCPPVCPRVDFARTAKLVEDTALTLRRRFSPRRLEKLPRAAEIWWIANSFSDLYLPSAVRWPRG